MNEVQVLTAHGRAPVLAALRQAAELLDRHPISARAPWLSCWIEAFGDHHPVGVTLRRDGTVVGFACLAIRRRGLVTDICLVGDGVSDYARLAAVDDATRRQLTRRVAELPRGRKGPWRLRFDQLPAQDPTVRLLAGLLPHSGVEPTDPSPVLRLTEPRTLEAHTHRRLRHHLRKATRKVAGHRVDLETFTDPSAVLAAWPPMEAVARARDHSVGRRSHLDDPRWRTFYRLALASLAARGETAVHGLCLDGRLAHYAVVLVDRGAWRVWDAKMDPAYAWSWPGHLLFAHILETALTDPEVHEVDWLRGIGIHESRASSDTRDSVRLVAYSGPFVRAWSHLGERARARARRTLPGPVKRALRGDLGPLLGAMRHRMCEVSPVPRGRSAGSGPGAVPARDRRPGA
ncbi:GNAT family N-acetyltransferase [Streptomyces sp. NPDC000070]|uniref:GNAT family N-acetyltransferase n=1 Tax=Streptomyces sp. NPDC000070 TaxID=3154240 RepID=UPI0033342401